jgi:UDP-N-acetylglucosamine/UDP-N-acetylgalactosamine diphosphorylase
MAKEALSEFLKPFSQEHLIQFWDELSEADQEVLDHEIKQIDFEEITSHYSRVKSTIAEEAEEIDSAMKPVPYELKGSFAHSSAEQLEEYNLEGLKAISEGQVACLLMAGGQGTRLGVSYPKGMYSVKLQSDKTLYQIQAERLLRLEHLAVKNFPGTSGKITWYIMTSEHTQIMTGDFFKSNDFFGLQSSQIQFFEQGMLPCLTNEGKLILDAKNKISKAPDGNGGLYKALNKRKVLDDMEARGIQFIHVYGVDNILVKISDPVFIGFCIQKQANCAAKVVKKVDPEEKVGVICKVHEKFQVVEYSEISEKTRNLRDENGELTYSAGSICNHFFNAKFLSDLCRYGPRKF